MTKTVMTTINNLLSDNLVTGCGFTPFAKNGPIPVTIPTGRIVINSIVQDALAGTSYTEEILSGKTVNSDYVCRLLAKPGVRDAFSQFFLSNRLLEVLSDVMEQKTWRVGGQAFSKERLLTKITSSVGDQDAAFAICECVMPALASDSLVAPGRPLFIKTSVAIIDPTIEDLVADFRKQTVMKAVADASAVVGLKAGVTYATRIIAEEYAVAFTALGMAVASSKDFELVLMDLVRGVRAKIDPQLTGLKGSVAEEVYNHEAVNFLSSNFTFVKAALRIKPDTTIRIMSDGHKFDKWAPTVLAMLRNSERYRIINKQAYIDTLGVKTVRNTKGHPVFAVMWENAKMSPTAMSVLATDDVMFPGATIVFPDNDRLDDTITQSFGELHNSMTPAAAALAMADIMMDAVECEDPGISEKSGLYYGLMNPRSLESVALMMADSVGFRISGTSVELVYRVNNVDKFFQPKSGVVAAGFMLTTDPVEVILCAEDREAKREMDVPPQLIGKSALYNSIIGLSKDEDFVSMNSRYSFSSNVLGVNLRGSFKTLELETLQVSSLVHLISPHHNSLVCGLTTGILADTYETIGKLEDPKLRSRAKRNFAVALWRMVDSLSVHFRGIVHKAIIERSVAGLPPEESSRMRTRVGQKAISTVTDVYALSVFLLMQGLVSQMTSSEDKPADTAEKTEVTVTRGAGSALDRRVIFAALLSDGDIVDQMLAIATPVL